MSYDFAIEIDTGGVEPLHVEPLFSDTHPAFDSDGMAGNVLITEQAERGYARCGNYTSNVSGMWAKCLTAAAQEIPQALRYAGVDDRRMFERCGPVINYVDGTKGERTVGTDRLCLRDFDGAPCRWIAPIFAAAVEWGVEHIDRLRESNPANGWGDAEGAVTYLWDIQRHCEAHPNGTLYISA